MSIIQKPLILHYLRAAGWTRDDGIVWRNHDHSVGLESNPWDARDMPRLSDVAGVDGDDYHDLIARLGVLAAAEHARSEAMQLDETAPRYRVLMREAKDLIELARVDPAKWEASR